MKVKLSQIRVNPSHDQVYTTREIDDLVESMEMNELLEPIVVTRDKFIISGFRRYFVAKFLGWEEIEVIIGDNDAASPEFTGLPQRNKSREVLSEIQQLYQNYTNNQGNNNTTQGTHSNQNNPDNSRQIESWYW